MEAEGREVEVKERGGGEGWSGWVVGGIPLLFARGTPEKLSWYKNLRWFSRETL